MLETPPQTHTEVGLLCDSKHSSSGDEQEPRERHRSCLDALYAQHCAARLQGTELTGSKVLG